MRWGSNKHFIDWWDLPIKNDNQLYSMESNLINEENDVELINRIRGINNDKNLSIKSIYILLINDEKKNQKNKKYKKIQVCRMGIHLLCVSEQQQTNDEYKSNPFEEKNDMSRTKIDLSTTKKKKKKLSKAHIFVFNRTDKNSFSTRFLFMAHIFSPMIKWNEV